MPYILMKLEPVRTKRNFETILDQIKALILSGELAPGDKLLTERELAERLEVSRTSVREVLSALNLAGILEIRPGEGIYVKRVAEGSVIEPLSLIMLLERDDVRHILEVRKALEVEAAGLAAERHTGADMPKMEAALAAMEDDVQKGNTGEQADLHFHLAIAASSHNPLLIRLMSTIHDTMNQTLKTTRQLWMSSTAGTPLRLFEEHKLICGAIKGRAKQKARELMYQHLWKVEIEMERISAAAKKG
ncbi:MAG TPA: FadR/GntR family transcriptional regulator [Spirochaetia bacterium]|nr:FadR/GntR family transcriptional regulator [Spirochaetia bacterium]